MDGAGKLKAEVETPGIDITLTGNFGGDRQMAVRTMLVQATAENEAHEIVDRVFRIFDRQKARYEIVDLSEELRKNEQALARFQEDMPAVEAKYQKEQAARDVEIEELRKRYSEIVSKAESEHDTSGRRGQFRPQGHIKSDLENVERQIAKVADEKAKVKAEREEFLKSHDQVGVKRYEEEIARLRGEIDKRKAVLGDAA
ncbi:hypothetical protein [Acidocella sp.]|jgi:predicted  nucleic acid-binding Zn-ribbon protein|uniref:hypothetical protein n=1 Tax=Acidocella sp. TaxID=50710 RepID=UPI002F3E4854